MKGTGMKDEGHDMKTIARLGIAGMIGLGWTVAATGQGISSTREIR